MRKLSIAIIMLASFVLTGCGGDSAENVAKDMVANLNEMASILTSVTDEASAKAAVPKIEAVREKMRECAKRAKAVGKVDAATETKINEMMQAGMTQAMQSIAVAQERLAAQPQLMAIIQPAMQGMENDL